MIAAKKLAKELKQSVDWLMSEKAGCAHWHLLTDDDGKEWSIVVGWSDGFNENEPMLFSDGSFAICSKIGYSNGCMETDFDIDFDMPYDEKTGECYDTNSAIPRNVNWLQLAKNLIVEFKTVTKECAFFIDDETGVA